jgi:HK97 gp10 family phage protein
MGKDTFKLEGGKELERRLKKLGDKVHRRVTRQAVNAAATPVVKAAKANAPKQSGLLKKAMGKKVATFKKTQAVAAIVGAKKSVQGEVDGKPRKPSRYAHLVEKGHINEHGEHVPAQPFLRPALEQTGEQAMSVMQTKFAAGIEKEAKKQA